MIRLPEPPLSIRLTAHWNDHSPIARSLVPPGNCYPSLRGNDSGKWSVTLERFPKPTVLANSLTNSLNAALRTALLNFGITSYSPHSNGPIACPSWPSHRHSVKPSRTGLAGQSAKNSPPCPPNSARVTPSQTELVLQIHQTAPANPISTIR